MQLYTDFEKYDEYELFILLPGRETSDKGQCLLCKGEVELMCGDPPCQGFSGMSRFNACQYSLFIFTAQ